jgi:endogenous inhibitor of DNA gyrase (YacG/DUF329 family)
MADMLVVECRTCGEVTPTGIAGNPNAPDSIEVENHTVQCPNCGDSHSYDKEDMYFAT